MAAKPVFLIISQVYVPDPASVGQHVADAAAEMAGRDYHVIVYASARGYDDPGKKYTLVVSGKWPTFSGDPLGKDSTKPITAAPAVDEALDPKGWKVKPPAAGKGENPRQVEQSVALRIGEIRAVGEIDGVSSESNRALDLAAAGKDLCT